MNEEEKIRREERRTARESNIKEGKLPCFII
jgi:hypothetical protein